LWLIPQLTSTEQSYLETLQQINLWNMKIVELCNCHTHLETIIDWNLTEWPKPARSREDVKQRIFGQGLGQQLPQTLILQDGDEPVGYATLVLYERGRTTRRVHWIDAVYIKPELRMKGLGSKLILAAVRKAAELGISELFALTQIPELYRKLGWTTVETHTDGTVVSKRIGKH
jgi:N-acetylglutamate synthase-like GNAT family acetyltransferase